MASEPAEPTTRPQGDVIDKAAGAVCDAYEVYAPAPGVLRSEAPNIARALADLGLLADPAQTTELQYPEAYIVAEHGDPGPGEPCPDCRHGRPQDQCTECPGLVPPLSGEALRDVEERDDASEETQ